MRHLPEYRRLLLMQSLLAGESVKKAAARVGTASELVTQLLLDTGAACRDHHDRTVAELAVDSVQCWRVWGFSYVGRRNAYAPEVNRGIPREGWAWVALHAKSGFVVDWSVASGDAAAAAAFLRQVRARLQGRMMLKTRGRELFLERASETAADGGEVAVLARLFGAQSVDGWQEAEAGALPGDFRRRCLNLELALSLHFSSRNFLGDGGGEAPAVRLGLAARGWSVADLAALA